MNLRELFGRPRKERPAVRRIKQIARHVGARSYLEIGVNEGLTFNGLDFERKVAVDPKFRFDVSAFRRDGIEFHEMTSDSYFTHSGRLEKFDLIFLDGLHTFAQTFRDFCNSMVCSHERTVWLIDDVLPVDVYSAWPNQSEALRYRRMAGGDGPAWNGDVFKVVFAIHDFFPVLSYITVGSADNSQTLVWRKPRPGFSPVFGRLEDIERLTYFEFLRHKEVLNTYSEEEGLRRFFAEAVRGEVS